MGKHNLLCLILLSALAIIATAYPNIRKYQECIPAGTNPQTIVREVPMRIRFTLGKTSDYIGFP